MSAYLFGITQLFSDIIFCQIFRNVIGIGTCLLCILFMYLPLLQKNDELEKTESLYIIRKAFVKLLLQRILRMDDLEVKKNF